MTAGVAEADTTLTAECHGFSASALTGGPSVDVRLSGTADLSVKTTLDAFLHDLHQLAQQHHSDRVVVDFRGLTFMNSSCLKGLVTWICCVQESAPDSRYRIILVASPDLHWQRRSFHALCCLAADLVTIQS